MFRCVMTTPFGSAVAPDVKMISTTVSRVGVNGASDAVVAAPGSAPSGFGAAGTEPIPPAATRARRPPTVPAGSSTSSPTSTTRASTMRATLPRKSGEAR